MLFRFSDGDRIIRCIYSKTVVGSDNDKVSFIRQYIVRHLIETVALFCVTTEIFFVRIYFYVSQVSTFFNALYIIVNYLGIDSNWLCHFSNICSPAFSAVREFASEQSLQTRMPTLPSERWKWSILLSSAMIFWITAGLFSFSATKASKIDSGICFAVRIFPFVLDTV